MLLCCRSLHLPVHNEHVLRLLAQKVGSMLCDGTHQHADKEEYSLYTSADACTYYQHLLGGLPMQSKVLVIHCLLKHLLTQATASADSSRADLLTSPAGLIQDPQLLHRSGRLSTVGSTQNGHNKCSSEYRGQHSTKLKTQQPGASSSSIIPCGSVR